MLAGDVGPKVGSLLGTWAYLCFKIPRRGRSCANAHRPPGPVTQAFPFCGQHSTTRLSSPQKGGAGSQHRMLGLPAVRAQWASPIQVLSGTVGGLGPECQTSSLWVIRAWFLLLGPGWCQYFMVVSVLAIVCSTFALRLAGKAFGP